MRIPLVSLSLLFAAHAVAEDSVPVRGAAWLSLSPDGGTLAFEWLSDIWIAPSQGGGASRVLNTPHREAYPKFSPDGTRLYFGSEQEGSVQLQSVKIDGSDLRTHTRHTEGNIPEAISADGTFAIVRGKRESSGYDPFRLIKVDLTADSRELELFDATAHSVSISPCGRRFLFCRGGEQLYRKGYRGSRASSIHLFDENGKNFSVLIAEEHEARSPMWKPDGSGFYYVSGREGGFDIWEGGFDGKPHKRLTSMGEAGVTLPALSADGKVMVFRSGQGIFRFLPAEGSAPQAVNLFTKEELPDRSTRKERVSGTSFAAFEPQGRRVVFSSAGDLWAMGEGDSSPRRLTQTDEVDEREPVLSPDGSELCFLRDDGLQAEVCAAAWDAGKPGEIRVIAKSMRSKRSLKMSPCGRRISWLEATGDLVTASLEDGEVRKAARAWDTPTYEWSPCGKWLVMAAKDIHSNRDIFLVCADGSRTPINLTRHPEFEGSPKFSPDGNFIVFTARREADGIARLWLVHVGGRLSGQPDDADLEAIEESIRPVGTDLGEPIRVTWSHDSRSILCQSRDEADECIYSVPVDGDEVSEFANFRGIPEGIGSDGRSFWRIGRVPAVLQEGKLTRFEFSFTVEQARRERLRLGFRRIWRTLGERFYDETMNATDWSAVLSKYEDAAAGALDSRQFDRVVAQMLGELNASHLTFKAKPWGVPDEAGDPVNPTAFPGLVFRNSWDGPLVIEKVLEGAPISQVERAPAAGEKVLRIGGKEVNARTPLHGFFNGAKGSALPIVVESPDGKERALELVPVSYPRARFLDRAASNRRAALAAAQAGRIAYLPFRKMRSEDLRELATEVYRASLESEGLILDLRDNVGGRVADELLALFCQPVHTFTIPRAGERGYPVDRRVNPSWDGPMVVLCNGNSFSNAEIFCHAFKSLGRGKLIGTPTNGGVISAVSVGIPEVGQLQVPFRGWFEMESGRDLELNGARPDEIVPIRPDHEVADQDPQLDAALRALGEEIRKRPAEAAPVPKSAR